MKKLSLDEFLIWHEQTFFFCSPQQCFHIPYMLTGNRAAVQTIKVNLSIFHLATLSGRHQSWQLCVHTSTHQHPVGAFSFIRGNHFIPQSSSATLSLHLKLFFGTRNENIITNSTNKKQTDSRQNSKLATKCPRTFTCAQI